MSSAREIALRALWGTDEFPDNGSLVMSTTPNLLLLSMTTFWYSIIDPDESNA